MDSVKWWADIDLRPLAERLGLTPAGAKHKWSCPRCGSRDNLHIYAPPRGAFCFGCGTIDAPDLVMEATRCTFKQALDWLGRPKEFTPKQHTKPKKRKSHMNAYTWIWQNAPRLSQEHQDWFRSRGLRPEYDCKTIGHDFWEEVCSFESAKEIGILNKNNKPHPWWKEPFLLVPYFARDKVEMIRFRRTHDEDGPKMLSLCGSITPSRPFGAERVEGVRGSTNFPDAGGLGDDPYPEEEMPVTAPRHLFVVEGEWDAYAVQQAGHDCVATPGAQVWSDKWTQWIDLVTKTTTEFGPVRRPIVIVGDGDEAGAKMARNVGKKLAHLAPKSFVWDNGDACDALKSGTLNTQIEEMITCQNQ